MLSGGELSLFSNLVEAVVEKVQVGLCGRVSLLFVGLVRRG